MYENNSSEKEIYQELISLGKSKDTPDVLILKTAKYLDHPSKKVQAKVLWMLGEFGLKNPKGITPYVNKIANKLKSKDAKIRQRAVVALGRIGRGNFNIIAPYISMILSKSDDPNPDIRMNFIWACENIATTSPNVFNSSMGIFAKLLDDTGIRVRRESPEIFRVIGKKIPNFVTPYIPKLKAISENDPDDVVRIHAAGAIKASTT